jgi:hypothetical protein
MDVQKAMLKDLILLWENCCYHCSGDFVADSIDLILCFFQQRPCKKKPLMFITEERTRVILQTSDRTRPHPIVCQTEKNYENSQRAVRSQGGSIYW